MIQIGFCCWLSEKKKKSLWILCSFMTANKKENHTCCKMKTDRESYDFLMWKKKEKAFR